MKVRMSAHIDALMQMSGWSENTFLALGLGIVLIVMVAAVFALACVSHRDLKEAVSKQRRRY